MKPSGKWEMIWKNLERFETVQKMGNDLENLDSCETVQKMGKYLEKIGEI